MKVETWNSHIIRFVEKDGRWWVPEADARSSFSFKDGEMTCDFRHSNTPQRKIKAPLPYSSV